MNQEKDEKPKGGKEMFKAKIVGSGAFWPGRYWSTEKLVELNDLRYPEGLPKAGQRLSPDWADRYFGIQERPLDLVEYKGEIVKLPYGGGGLYGVDMGTKAAKQAIEAAGIQGWEVDVLIEASATHDSVGVGEHLGHYIRELGLPEHVLMTTMPIGCGGFLQALRLAMIALETQNYVLVILHNCPSAQFANAELRARYRQNLETMACYMVFSDMAVAFVLKKDQYSGFTKCWSFTKSGEDYRLIYVPVGGGINPPLSSNLDGATYFMKTGNVQRTFPELMVENWRLALEMMSWQVDQRKVGEYIYHQASKPGIEEAVRRCPDIDRRKVHTIMEHLGNPAICSGPLVLHQALAQRGYASGTLIPLMLLGAGNGGAQHGAAWYEV